MDLDNATINNECDEVAQAIQQVRDTFRSRSNIKTAELLDRFWDFQDCLHRLVNTLSDNHAALSHLDQTYPRLTSDAADVLNFASKTLVGGIPAVRYSCHAIQELLLQIQNLRSFPALTASA